MKIDVHEDASGITLIKLTGRMDVAGSGEVDTKLNILAGIKPKIVVDMADVDFLASLGMRTLVTGAKAMSKHGGKFVLTGLQPNVEKALASAGLDSILDIAPDMPSAVARIS